MAAQALIEQGALPTALRVREYIGSGSLSTVQKYFRAWKQSCWQGQVGVDSINQPEAPVALPGTLQPQLSEYRRLYEEEREHTRTLLDSIRELETTKIKYSKQIRELEETQQNLQSALQTLEYKYTSLEQVNKEILAERESALTMLLTDKNQQIAALQSELKLTHEYDVQQIREVGYKGDEALIQAKVNIIHLQDQLSVLQTDIDQLNIKLEKAQNANVPLRNHIQQQEQFIREVVSWEQLKIYEERCHNK